VRRWSLLLPAALLLSGCGLPGEQEARPLDPGEAPFRLSQPPPAASPTGPRRQRLYLVRGGELVAVPRTASALTPQAALTDLLAGPTATERTRGLSTALPVSEEVPPVTVEDGVAVVELASDGLGPGRSDDVLAYGQLVATLDATPTVRAVRFVSGETPLRVPKGDGVLTSDPVSLADYREQLSDGAR
jgi:hypothetical protein